MYTFSAVFLYVSYLLCHVSAQEASIFNKPFGSSNAFGTLANKDQSLQSKLGLRTNIFQNDRHRLDGQIHGTHTFTPHAAPQYGAGGILDYSGRGRSGSLSVDRNPSGIQMGAEGSATIWRPNKNSNLDAFGQYSQSFNKRFQPVTGPYFGAGLRYNF